MFPLFVDDLGFINLDSLVKKLVKSFENVVKAILEWKRLNAVTYNVAKTKTVFFSKLH